MFRFTIRDLLWLTVVVVLGVAWWVNFWKLREARETNEYFLQAIDRAGWMPDGDYIGPNLSKKSDMPNPSAPTPNLPHH